MIYDFRSGMCGGDPFRTLKNTLKKLSGELAAGEPLEVIYDPTRFLFKRPIITAVADELGYGLTDFQEVSGREIHVMLVAPEQSLAAAGAVAVPAELGPDAAARATELAEADGPPPIPTVTVAELQAEIDAGLNLLVIDLRQPEDVAQWQVGGTRTVPTLNITYPDFMDDPDAAVARLPRDRSLTLVCPTGSASAYVGDELMRRGFRVRNVDGGMAAYSELYTQRVVHRDADLQVVQFNRVAKACLSYLIAAGSIGVVVDAGQHPEPYLDLARRLGVNIRHVVDTHLHADHVSGGRALAQAAGARYHLPAADAGAATFTYNALGDGDRIPLGLSPARLVAMATPGHTRGSICLLLGDRFLFTGDTLFVASVGRPDLGGEAAALAPQLWETVSRRLAALDESVLVLPGHYAVAAELDAGGRVAATLGQLRRQNAMLAVTDPDTFVQAVLGDLPEHPPAYGEIRRVNQGLAQPGADRRVELDVGKNLCAATAWRGA